MTASVDTRGSAIRGELMRVRSDLVEARSRQQHKDSTSNRAALAACLTTMDGVLDRYLATNRRS
jgi:hypothetical protein